MVYSGQKDSKSNPFDLSMYSSKEFSVEHNQTMTLTLSEISILSHISSFHILLFYFDKRKVVISMTTNVQK